MRSVADFVKEFLIPGSSWFLLIGVTIAVGLLKGPASLRRWGLRLLVVLSALYWALSLPVVAERLASASSALTGQDTAADPDVTAAVVLSNGIDRYKAGALEIGTLVDESAYTVLEALRFYRRGGSPLLVVSGGNTQPGRTNLTEAAILAVALEAEGIPHDRILLESRSTTTEEQAVNVAPLLRERGITAVALITSSSHMPRALSVFRAQGLDARPRPSAYGSPDTFDAQSRWRPSGEARSLSQRSIYDAIGWLYYRARGWGRSRAS